MSKTKVTLSAGELTEKWGRRLQQAVPDIQRGVQACSVDPGQEAVKKQEKMLQNTTEAITSGRWARARLAVSKESWQQATIAKVGTRLPGGITQAKEKHEKFASYLINTINSGLPAINNMPDMTLDDNINRMASWARYMNANRYKK